jgi:two-component system, OmpR family, response regulator
MAVEQNVASRIVREKLYCRPEVWMKGNGADRGNSVLLVDDDVDFLAELSDFFVNAGFLCRTCDNWASALEMLNGWQPNLIVLDQRLGPVDTLLLLPTLRQHSSAPVLFLTGGRSEADRVIGLELGADDFLLKPISGRELVARVRAHLRRGDREEVSNGHEWRIVPVERKVLRPDGTSVPLTSTEFELLSTLAAHPGVPVERDELSRHVLRRPFLAEDRALDNLVHQIRRKFGCSGAGEVIASVRNVGYVFRGYPD